MSAIRIGWFVDTPAGDVAYEPPVPLREVLQVDNPRAATALCPAITHHIGRVFAIRAPFTFRVSVRIGPASCALVLDQERSSVMPWRAKELLRLVQTNDWRCRTRPVLQLMLPYTFVTDDDVEIRQLPPYLHFFPRGRPGVVLPGEFALPNWPRPLSWAFEWHDVSEALHIKRGEVLYYVAFERLSERSVRLEAVTKSLAIGEQQRRIGGVAGLVRNSLRLTEAAGQGRPESLLPPPDRPDTEGSTE